MLLSNKRNYPKSFLLMTCSNQNDYLSVSCFPMRATCLAHLNRFYTLPANMLSKKFRL